MGLFNFVCGTFQCVRCNAVVNACIQTKLFFTDESNSSIEYRSGDSVIIDGLDDYCALYPPNWSSAITLVMGDWDCSNCGLNCQWSRVTLSVTNRDARAGVRADVNEVTVFVPRVSADFCDINYIEEDLARLSDYPNGLTFDLNAFNNLRVEEKIALIVSGYERWYTEIAVPPDDYK